jgi:hypothetical protein
MRSLNPSVIGGVINSISPAPTVQVSEEWNLNRVGRPCGVSYYVLSQLRCGRPGRGKRSEAALPSEQAQVN